MADIFDLARNINRQREQAKQGYGSPLEDLPLQIAEIMHTRDKEKRVSLKNDSVVLSKLIEGATSAKEIENISKLATQYRGDTSYDSETKLWGDFIEMKANQKKDEYNQFSASAEWLDTKLEEDEGKGIAYFKLSEEELMDMPYEEITRRIEEVESYKMGMEYGDSGNFKYAKGANTVTTLKSTFDEYEKKLENTL